MGNFSAGEQSPNELRQFALQPRRQQFVSGIRGFVGWHSNQQL
jgi:hypothetical protein